MVIAPGTRWTLATSNGCSHTFNLHKGIAMNIRSTLFATALFAAAGAAIAGAGPSDAQIAAIVVAANQVDVDAGELAKARAADPEVKKFAQLMINDHSGVNKQAVDLVTRLKVTPEENDTSRALKQGGAEALARLKGLNGKAFDKAYVDNEVAYHEKVLGALDQTLIPAAANAELKALLVKVRPAFVAHLEHARHMRAALK
jgi:putative membrane protein